jgi:hypothetical protein
LQLIFKVAKFGHWPTAATVHQKGGIVSAKIGFLIELDLMFGVKPEAQLQWNCGQVGRDGHVQVEMARPRIAAVGNAQIVVADAAVLGQAETGIQ